VKPLNRLAGRFGRTAAPGNGQPASDAEQASAALSCEAAVSAGVLALGPHSYGSPRVIVYPGDTGSVRIGRYCSIADSVSFMVGGNHRPDWVTTYPLRVMLGLPGALADGHPATKGDIVVGNDVWIGADARVLSGVEIGDGAVIGTGAIVAGDVRPYAIAVGNPAREIRRRFPDETIEALRRIAWWDWPDEVVRERVEELSNPDVEAFARRYDAM
jgi:acetyltransferase-like isoleucine patch superfamily enzyme